MGWSNLIWVKKLYYTVSLAKDVLPKLTTKAFPSALDKFERKKSGNGVVRAEKRFTLLFSNEDMDDIIKTIEWLAK